jgi:hypothetical protein
LIYQKLPSLALGSPPPARGYADQVVSSSRPPTQHNATHLVAAAGTAVLFSRRPSHFLPGSLLLTITTLPHYTDSSRRAGRARRALVYGSPRRAKAAATDKGGAKTRTHGPHSLSRSSTPLHPLFSPQWRTWRRTRRQCAGRWTRRCRSSRCGRPSTCSAAPLVSLSLGGRTRRRHRPYSSVLRSVGPSAHLFPCAVC